MHSLIATCARDMIYNCNIQGPAFIPRDGRVKAHGVADIHSNIVCMAHHNGFSAL